ncbi:GLPGLI family protein [Chryseobacterium sp.]|uniref:GLPGLI family protein n=1 Tax=Chryseobacterium sp. TaxID=1871047 RepID=UPI0011C8E09E|nr:GLPGLI family protein [Chryseobacterium sp.]TXF76134.1 GLPGLI family protein [Chryseobacterium sp.]
MNIKVILSFMFVFYLVNIEAQNKHIAELEVIYRMKYVGDSLNKSSIIEGDMILLANNETSIYFNPQMVDYYKYLDEQALSINSKNLNVTNLPSIPKIRHNVLREKENIISTIPLGRYHYIFKESKLNWELVEGKKEILGLECNLAKVKTESDVYYAWYAPVIPIPDGPFRFKGLPGLIVEVYNRNKTIEFSAISISKTDKPIDPINDVAVIKLNNKDQFLKIREQYITDPFQNNTLNREIKNRITKRINNWNVFLD